MENDKKPSINRRGLTERLSMLFEAIHLLREVYKQHADDDALTKEIEDFLKRASQM